MKNKDTTPLTAPEIEQFLLSRRHGSCTWCGEDEWAVHIQPTANALVAESPPGVRALSEMRLSVDPDKPGVFNANISLEVERTLPVTLVECGHCGCVTAFNYFTLLRLIRRNS